MSHVVIEPSAPAATSARLFGLNASATGSAGAEKVESGLPSTKLNSRTLRSAPPAASSAPERSTATLVAALSPASTVRSTLPLPALTYRTLPSAPAATTYDPFGATARPLIAAPAATVRADESVRTPTDLSRL